MPGDEPCNEHEWVLLTYKLPPNPARHRVAIWRKLKSLGGVYLQNGVCVLPKTDEHVRRTRVIVKDIERVGGDAILMETVTLSRSEELKLIDRFAAARDEAYIEFISRCDDFEAEIAKERAAGKFIYAEVEENEEDLAKLRTWFQKITTLDFFGAPRRAEAEDRLQRCAVILDDYAWEVFEAEDGGRQASNKRAE